MRIITRLEKKLILKNKLFIKQAFPRLKKIQKQVKLVFSSDSALDDFRKAGKDIFSDFSEATKVLIKINLNSANNYPASTSLQMLESVIEGLKNQGVRNICVGDCSGLIHFPTRNVMKKKGLFYLGKKYGIKIKAFDYGGWVNILINGEYFKNIILTDSINKFDRIINLTNLKSHQLAKFSFATKSLIGFMHPFQRYELHSNNLEERVAEISLAIRPDISIIDARKIFIDGGPDMGVTADANTIIVDTDILEADIAAYKLLYKNKVENSVDDISQNPFDNLFFKHFIKINNSNL